MDDLSIVYTPGVASVCRKIHADPELAYKFTSIQRNVAIVTNGTAILGLGDIGPVAGMPVMEGKALLFRLLAGINGYPVLIDSKDADVIVEAVKAIAPTFGAIKLEDIAAPHLGACADPGDQDLRPTRQTSDLVGLRLQTAAQSTTDVSGGPRQKDDRFRRVLTHDATGWHRFASCVKFTATRRRSRRPIAGADERSAVRER